MCSIYSVQKLLNYKNYIIPLAKSPSDGFCMSQVGKFETCEKLTTAFLTVTVIIKQVTSNKSSLLLKIQK